MWAYEKNLMYPVRIANPDPAMAKLIITQLGGPDGELGAAMRYLTQRFAQPYAQGKAVLTDIGTEELAHCEMIGAIVYQLTHRSKSSKADLTHILLTTPMVFIRRQQAARRFLRQPCNPPVMRLPICLKIWRPMVRLCKNNVAENP